MPAYLGPPPFPWLARLPSAFNPARAWLPCDHGARFKEFIRGDDAALSGTYSWGSGSYGRCLTINPGSGLTPGLGGGLPAGPLTVTVAHWRPPDAPGTFPDLLGWGDGASGQYGIGYQPGYFGLTNFSGVAINQVALAYPADKWRVTTVMLAGVAAGSAVEYWVDGARIYVGTLPTDFPAPSRFRIGASNNGNLTWRGGIGPSYAHDRVLSGHEIRLLHADPWRVLRDFRSDTPRKLAAIPPPFDFDGEGTAAPLAGGGALAFDWPLSAPGASAAPSGAGSLEHGWETSGVGAAGIPSGAGEVRSGWFLFGAGQSAGPVGSVEFAWPWSLAGAGRADGPSGAGSFDWAPPFPNHADPRRGNVARGAGRAEPGWIKRNAGRKA